MRIRTYALAGALSLSSLGMYAYLALSGGGDHTTEDSIHDQLSRCTNGVMTLMALRTPEAARCMTEVSTRAVESGGIKEIQEALDLISQEVRGFQQICHDIGHYAGRSAYIPGSDIKELLGQATEACIYGFGHGVMDGIAASRPTLAILRETAEACADFDGARAGLCADGIGHLAWASTHDLEVAVAICDYIPYESRLHRGQCGEGIVMQIYDPAGFLPSAEVSDAPAELLELCDSWPPEPADIREGCYTGAGYVYMLPVSYIFHLWASGSMRSGEAEELMVKTTTEAAHLCSLHTREDGVDLCERGVYYQVPATAHMLSEGAKERMCSVLRGDNPRLCMEYSQYFG